MRKQDKKEVVVIRIEKYRKQNWKKTCRERKMSLTSLVIDSVENKILDNERRAVLQFLEKQDNLFAKIETNINQIAKVANAQKFMSVSELNSFMEKLTLVLELKAQQNEIFRKIYSLIANDC